MGTSNESAKVIAPPPLIYLAFLGVGILLHFLWKSLHIFAIWWIGHAAGWPLFLAALGLFVWAVLTMTRAGENVRVETPTNALVAAGPYRRSRNPIYLSMTLAHVSISLLVHSWWPLIFLPVAVLVIHFGVVLREERYLDARLGEPYREYKARVRRWV